MVKMITLNALVLCPHITGKVVLIASQQYVTIEQVPILVDNDPESRTIGGCSWIGLGITPCLATLPGTVRAGYSTLITIDGKAVCLDTLTGMTNGTPGDFLYTVHDAGQSLITVVE